MRLQMRGVDHDPRRLADFGSQLEEYLVEYAQSASAHEATADRLVRTVFPRRVAPAQPVPMTNMMALTMRQSSSRAIPCESGKHGPMRRIWDGESKNKSVTASLRLPYEISSANVASA